MVTHIYQQQINSLECTSLKYCTNYLYRTIFDLLVEDGVFPMLKKNNNKSRLKLARWFRLKDHFQLIKKDEYLSTTSNVGSNHILEYKFYCDKNSIFSSLKIVEGVN